MGGDVRRRPEHIHNSPQVPASSLGAVPFGATLPHQAAPRPTVAFDLSLITVNISSSNHFRNVYKEPLKKCQVEGCLLAVEPDLLFGNLDQLCRVGQISVVD